MNRDLIVAIRERDRLYKLTHLCPDNEHLAKLYLNKKQYVDTTIEQLRGSYHANRITAAAGDDRKTWQLYKEIVFNRYRQKQEESITVNCNDTDNSVSSCIKNHFFQVNSKLSVQSTYGGCDRRNN